ncbi:hypothetical protein GCM10008967_05160 [Bacillus carboniphilus]|uniref:DUF4183 domain-containing protein n=1 Tax=Bacillus carboniphilus TaxID=86663 RepID=A0ABN0VUD5_9BACI
MSKKININNELPKPCLTIPILPPSCLWIKTPKKVKVYEYYTLADGIGKKFKEKDGIKELGKQVILDPHMVSYMNLFINGVLQPKESYIVKKGTITLKTTDVPPKGAPIILQMIII